MLTGAVAAAATLAVVGVLTGVVGGSGTDSDLVLGAAVDTVVVFPDGTNIDGWRGLALPDGAVVRTGPHGRAAAGGVELGPGLEAIVDAGELLTDRVQAAPAEPVTPDGGAATAAAAVIDDASAPASVKPDAAALTDPVADAGRRSGLPGGSPSAAPAPVYPRSEVATGR